MPWECRPAGWCVAQEFHGTRSFFFSVTNQARSDSVKSARSRCAAGVAPIGRAVQVLGGQAGAKPRPSRSIIRNSRRKRKVEWICVFGAGPRPCSIFCRAPGVSLGSFCCPLRCHAAPSHCRVKRCRRIPARLECCHARNHHHRGCAHRGGPCRHPCARGRRVVRSLHERDHELRVPQLRAMRSGRVRNRRNLRSQSLPSNVRE